MRKRDAWVLLGAATVSGLAWFGPLSLAKGATQEPANKSGASESTAQIVGPGEDVELLSETVKTSDPADLLLAVTLECSIVTDVTTVGNDDQTAMANIDVWVTIDGHPVTVSSDDGNGGKVTFCNRKYQRQTANLGEDDTIRTFFSTKSAHGFNWMALNTGAATHTIKVMATLQTQATDTAHAEAVVGNRTLIVEPLHMATNETVDNTTTTTSGGSSSGLPIIGG